KDGESITKRGTKMPWYSGGCLLDFVGNVRAIEATGTEPFRLFVQDHYEEFPGRVKGRVYVGMIESGRGSEGDELAFFPSGDKAKIQRLVEYPENPDKRTAGKGQSVALEFDPPVNLERGDLCVDVKKGLPVLQNKFRATVFWFSATPLAIGKVL